MPPAQRALRWVAFAPFVVVALIQLATKVTDDHGLDTLTKALCVPLLTLAAVAVLIGARRRLPIATTALLALALLCSWIGDVLIEVELVLGLAAFLVAHIAFVGTFVLAFERRVSRWALLAVPWYVALVVVLAPRLGGLLVPVLLYGLVLGAMAAAATRGGALTTLGAVLFVVSDTILALRLFTPYVGGDASEVAVMLSYLAAMTLIVLGMVSRLVGWPTPSSSGSAPAISRTPRSRASRSPG